MFSHYLNPTPTIAICFGIFLLIVFIIISLLKKKTDRLRLTDATNIFFNGAGIIAGLKVLLMSVENNIPLLSDDNRPYICLGGIALVWAATDDFIKKIK